MMTLEGRNAAPVTVLGFYRKELAHGREHQQRVAEEWDRTLAILKDVDFQSIGPGDRLAAIRGEVEIWNDLTLDPPRRISMHDELGDLPMDPDERYEYLHRVFIGLSPGKYLTMCDEVEQELDAVASSKGPTPVPQLRDRIVELMELGVRCSARSTEWMKKRYQDVNLAR
ncbi:MAG: hypothetical protein KAS77_13710 [Thermoplasmata archaeon]|nr:hypothetical protein [Thermoplasmata archaeon]